MSKHFKSLAKSVFLVLSALVLGTTAYSQDKFRQDYSCVASFDPKTEKWSDWSKGENTFVFNINDNGDIKLFKANGESEVYRKVGKLRKDQTDDGRKYQIMAVLDEEGDELLFQLFSEGDAKFIYKSGFLIQFSNCD